MRCYFELTLVIGILLVGLWKDSSAQTNNIPLSVPLNVRVGRFYSNGIEILWDYTYPESLESGDVAFLVQYKRANESSWSVSSLQNETKMYITPLQKLAWYQARVKAQRTNNLSSESSWTPVFLFTMPADKSVPGNASTPRDVTAALLSPTSVHLRWSSSDRPIAADDGSDVYFLVDVEARNDLTGDYEKSRQVRVKSTSFILDQLQLGTAYRFRVVTHSGHQESEPSDWNIIRMPTEAEMYTISNLRFGYSDDSPGLVNLSWSVPDRIKQNIYGYALWFATSRDTDLWSQQFFPGSDPTATLYNLAPNTTYYLTIETQLIGGRKTESSVFQFRTPPINPIQSVDVIYSKIFSTVRLQWTPKPFVDRSSIIGYELYLSENYSAPDAYWKRFATRETWHNMQNLRLGGRHYVKFRILYKDGSSVAIPTIYHFSTMNDHSEMKDHSITLTYQRASRGVVKIRWEFPPDIERKVVSESLVLYTNEPNKPDLQWMKVMVPGHRREVTLTGIMPQTPYYVKVLPRVHGSTMDMSGSAAGDTPSVFFLNPIGETDTNVTSEIIVANRISDQRPIENDDGSDLQAFCMKKCRASTNSNVQAERKTKRQSNLEQGCASNEQCVVVTHNASIGYCVPSAIVTALKNDTST